MADEYVIRDATRDDMTAICGKRTGATFRAWAVEKNGTLVAVGGVVYGKPLIIGFSRIAAGAEMKPQTVWRLTRKLWNNVMALGHPVIYAIADPDLPTAPAFLERLGFKHIESDVRGEIYEWQTP
ncbi:MAG: hypothetical protein WC130_03570 [Kiritimatiellia bacterium]